MKAAAYRDCTSKGERAEALTYRGDVLKLRDRLDEVDWEEVHALLERFPDARAKEAFRVIKEVFGVKLEGDGRRGITGSKSTPSKTLSGGTRRLRSRTP